MLLIQQAFILKESTGISTDLTGLRGVNTPERRRVADSDDIILQYTLSCDAKF